MSRAAKQAGKPDDPSAAHELLSLHGGLALDLINTEVIDRGKRRDLLSSPDDLASWWKEACEQYAGECIVEGAGEPIAWTSELFHAVKALRMALRTLITQVVERQAVEEEDLKPVNQILASGYSLLERTAQGNVKVVMHLRNPEQGSILFPIALSALRLFTESDWRRLHQCKNDRCIIFFYDTTKSGTRRWCSTVCMNRARSIQHYQQTRKGASPQ